MNWGVIGKIADSMREFGWEGPPLLVHHRGDGFYEAWMGTHRLKGAELADLDKIPIVEMGPPGGLDCCGFHQIGDPESSLDSARKTREPS